MYTYKNRRRASAIGLGVVCLLAVGLSVASILSTHRMQTAATMIYEHPYTVSNEARAMRSRLLDMRGFIVMILTDPDRDLDQFQKTLEGRYALQQDSINIITSQYLGPVADTARLSAAMQALREAQTGALPLLIKMTDEEIIRYVEDTLYARYDALDDALTTIITFADNKVRGLENASAEASRMAEISLTLLTVFLPAYFLVVFWRDRRSMREIAYREHLFDVLSTNVDEVFFIYGKDRKNLEYVSANIERVLEIDESVLAENDRILEQWIVEEDRAAFQAFMDFRSLDAPKSLDARMRFPSGALRWMRLRLYPQIVDGRIYRYIASLSDQTESMRVQQTLRDALLNAQSANAAKQNFLSRMSHEIRTPMNAIIGMATIAAAYIEDRSRVEDCLEKIGYSSKHLMTLINDVLDMSKIDEGKLSIAHERFNLETVAESVTSIIYPQATAKGLTFTMPLVDVTDTALVGDALRLNQVLLNLLSNALKFTPTGGSVRLEIRQLQRKGGQARLRFTVSDTGIGMDESFMERLFQPFEQESAAIGQKYGGTGLGMSITKNLVTLMGGTISVQSAPEKGSTFTVELDFDLPEEAASAPPRQQALESLQVLIADDDQDSCIHTSLLLENLGILSSWVLTGTECVEKALSAHRSGEDYDVCLIDWKMPDLDGVEVTRRIREFVGPDTTIIIITAYDWSAIEQGAREAGANAFLSKPIFASTLYNTLLSTTGIDKAVRVPVGNEELQQPDLAGRRVLLVEDNDLNREIAVELLRMADIEVECACNGREAVDRFLLDGDRYDLILMDVQMPVMDGYQATEAIRSSGRPRAGTIPIVAMTADAFHEDMVKATAAGMNAHLAKPIDVKSLYGLMHDLMQAGSAK